MMFPLVADLAAEGVPVRLACGVLGFSTQAFYKWRARPCSDRDWSDAHTINTIVDVHADDPDFGYRFIGNELETLGAVWRFPKTFRWLPEYLEGHDVRQKRWSVDAAPVSTVDAICRSHGRLVVGASELLAAARGENVTRRRSGIPRVVAHR